MLITKPQVHIVTREVILATGERAWAYFAVIDINGVLDIKFLGTKLIEEQVAPEAQILLIEGPKTSVYQSAAIKSPFEKVSHYFSLDFLVNQLARAPSSKTAVF
jgi:hypothetical protein